MQVSNIILLTIYQLNQLSILDTIQVNSPKNGDVVCIDKPMAIDYQNMRNGMAVMKSISVNIVQLNGHVRFDGLTYSKRPPQEADWHYKGPFSPPTVPTGNYEVQVIGEADVPLSSNPADRRFVVRNNVSIIVSCCGRCQQTIT